MKNTNTSKKVMLNFSHRSFKTGKTAIVSISEKFELISDYRDAAKKKVCEQLNLPENEIVIFDFHFLGSDVLFVE